MALSDVMIANEALSMLGEPRITVLTQDVPRAKALNEVFVSVRESCLRRYPWSFAIARASVAADGDPTEWGVLNRYRKPSDFLRLIRDDETGRRNDWAIEGLFIVTRDAAPLEFKYIRKVTDPQEFDSLFDEYFAVALAVRTCKAITGSNGQLADLRQEMKRVVAEARQVNAFEKDAQVSLDDDWVLAGHI